ncbi:MAG: hypothetical protein RBU45_00430 [Myxococcota bacterium]|jgi:hypothetical protein|nr:hypothetical protein [Myxococcota bacterium]
MKRNLLTTSLIALLALTLGAFIVACEVEDDTDGEIIAEGEGEGEGAEGEGEGEEPLPFRWARICSITDQTTVTWDKRYPGPDIDAVSLEKSDGAVYWASQLGDVDVAPTSEGNLFPNANKALGQSDTNSTRPEDEPCTNAAKCAGFVSVGLRGHYIIVGFGADIEEGDKMTVYEVGAKVVIGTGTPGKNEPSKVSLSVQSQNTGEWIAAASGADEFTFEAPSSNGPIGTCP